MTTSLRVFLRGTPEAWIVGMTKVKMRVVVDRPGACLCVLQPRRVVANEAAYLGSG